MSAVSCPSCQQNCEVPANLVGGSMTCPNCRGWFQVPAVDSPQPPPFPASRDEIASSFDFEKLQTYPPSAPPPLPRAINNKPKYLLWGSFVGIALLLLVGVCSLALGATKEQRLVRKWLKENLNDPTWEEVEWSQPVDLKESYFWNESRASGLSKIYYPSAKSDPVVRFNDNIWRKIDILGTAIRLKYRAKNGFGAKVLSDKIFAISGGEVIEIYDIYDFRKPRETASEWASRTGYDKTIKARQDKQRDAFQGGLIDAMKEISE